MTNKPVYDILENTRKTSDDDDFIMKPKVDFCFKELMNNERIRKAFVSALLDRQPDDLREVRLLPTELSGKYPDEKLGILDVRISLEDGTQMDLEMQVAYLSYWIKRTLFYLTRMYSEQLKAGESYDACRKCIHVSILDFNLFPGDAARYHRVHLREDERSDIFSELLELQILELRKLPEDNPSEDAPVQDWICFFAGETKEDFEKMAQDNPMLSEAYDVLKRLSNDETMRLAYETREKAIRDYNSQMIASREEGLAEGLAKGRSEGIAEGLAKGILGAIMIYRDEMHLDDTEISHRIRDRFSLTEEEADQYIRDSQQLL